MTDKESKAGFVVLLGRPNAGKSTLLNALLKSKLSIVSSKPQTTRHRILGILDGEGFQACLVDTPGLIENPKDPLQNCLRRQAMGAAHEDPDVMVLVVEPAAPSEDLLRELASLNRAGKPLLLVLNKADLPARPGALDRTLQAYADALKPTAAFQISALKKEGVEDLLKKIVDNQGTDGVDTISGATYSSRGILKGAAEAIQNARTAAATRAATAPAEK